MTPRAEVLLARARRLGFPSATVLGSCIATEIGWERSVTGPPLGLEQLARQLDDLEARHASVTRIEPYDQGQDTRDDGPLMSLDDEAEA